MTSVYIETSIVSYLRQSQSVLEHSRIRQEQTLEWWLNHRQRYRIVTAQYVIDEANAGHPDLVSERLRHLVGVPLLPLPDLINDVAEEILNRSILPRSATLDALHIACAAVNHVEYLLTWNCKHIANPIILPRVYRVLSELGLDFPVICTPADLMGESDEQVSK